MAKFKRTAKWMNKLTVKELKHMAETSSTGRPNLTTFKANRAAQRELKEKSGCLHEPCWDCLFIARKLGLEV